MRKAGGRTWWWKGRLKLLGQFAHLAQNGWVEHLGEGGALHPLAGQRDAGDLLEVLEVLRRRVVGAAAVGPQVELGLLDKAAVDLVQIEVVAVDADDVGPHGVDVEVDGLAERGAGRGLAADGVPLIGEDTLADGGVGALAVDRDADAHGDLPVLVGSRPTYVERDPKSTFLSIHMLHVLSGCRVTPPCAKTEHAKCRES